MFQIKIVLTHINYYSLWCFFLLRNISRKFRLYMREPGILYPEQPPTLLLPTLLLPTGFKGSLYSCLILPYSHFRARVLTEN